MESDDGTFMPLGFQFAGLFKENKFQNQHYLFITTDLKLKF